MELKFTISVIPRTKKNSMRIGKKRDGTPVLLPSQAYTNYARTCWAFIPRRREPIKERVNVKAVFYMPPKRRVDLVNLQEALLDILVHYGLLEDDNSSIVYSMDGSYVDYDKQNPRTEVTITSIQEEEGHGETGVIVD